MWSHYTSKVLNTRMARNDYEQIFAANHNTWTNTRNTYRKFIWILVVWKLNEYVRCINVYLCVYWILLKVKEEEEKKKPTNSCIVEHAACLKPISAMVCMCITQMYVSMRVYLCLCVAWLAAATIYLFAIFCLWSRVFGRFNVINCRCRWARSNYCALKRMNKLGWNK